MAKEGKMMNKIGIVTLNGYFNYGNRLQNYALQEKLKTLGYDVETLIIDIDSTGEYREHKNSTMKNSIVGRISNLSKKSMSEIIRNAHFKLWKIVRKHEIKQLQQDRKVKFKNFTLKHINETEIIIRDDKQLMSMEEEYDYFIVGSDQVWNPNYNNMNAYYFLQFASRYKRISYAASFGITDLSIKEEKVFSQYLKEMNQISVREEAGANIVKKLTGREPIVVLDPTFLLSAHEWLSISSTKLNIPKKNYLLTYFLGTIPEEYRKKIYNIAKNHDMDVINLADIRNDKVYKTGPSEFISYIYNCSLFCTDSFHGTVFSIIFEKPFIVYERMGGNKSMFSRIETLLKKFNLENRSDKIIRYDKNIFNIDYTNATEVLDIEREKADLFLKNALEIK